MKYFGKPDLLRESLLEELVVTPVGEQCLWCEQPVLDDDSGILQPFVASGDLASLRPSHQECFLRQVTGSVGHQLGLCSCPGNPGRLDDVPKMTQRESNRAACDLFKEMVNIRQAARFQPDASRLLQAGWRMGTLPEPARSSMWEVYFAIANGTYLDPNARPLNSQDLLVLECVATSWERALGLRRV